MSTDKTANTLDFQAATQTKITAVEALITALTGNCETMNTLQVIPVVKDTNKIRYGIEKKSSQYSGREKWHLEAVADYQTGSIQYVFRDYRNFDELEAPEVSKPEELKFGHNVPETEIAVAIAEFTKQRLLEDEEKMAAQKGITVEELTTRPTQSLEACLKDNGHHLQPAL